ncbi:MAG: glycosyltransferase family 39 protein [Chloroflexi bacterium]|nr:glycosyltransferase family 39 protein [Chloroflexota bacterium]
MTPLRRAAGMAGALALAAMGYVADDLLVMIAAALVAAIATAPSSEASGRQALRTFRADTTLNSRTPVLLIALAAVASASAALISQIEPAAAVANYLWLGALILVGVAAGVHDHIGLHSLQMPGKRAIAEIACVTLIALIAFGLRAWNVQEMPPIMHGDEGEMGVIARGILSGVTPPLFEASPFFSLPYVLNYLQAASLAIFGVDEFGLRMLSVIAGTACIPLIYVIGRQGWGVAGGLGAAWLMAVAHMQIHYSRLGFVFIESVLFMLVMMAALAVAGSNKEPDNRWSTFAVAGLAMGLGQYFYFASRVMPIVAAPLVLHMLFTRRATLRQAIVMAAAVLIAFAPLGAYFATHLDVFIDRVSFVSVLRDDNIAHVLGRPGTLSGDWPLVLATQMNHNLRLFVRGGDAGGFYFQNIPGLDPIMSILFWIGLGIAASQTPRFASFALVVWFTLGLFFGGVLTIDAPSAQRLTVMLPTTCLFGALGLSAAWNAVASLRVRPVAAIMWRAGALGVLLSVVAVLTWLNIDLYFRQYANGAQGREAITVARLARAEPEGTAIVLMGRPVLYSNHGAIKYLAPGITFSDPKNAADVSIDPSRGALILAVPDRLNDLKVIQAQYPGTLNDVVDPLGRLVLAAYHIARR